MRTLVDISDELVRELDLLAEREGVSRASLIRDAVRSYLVTRRRTALDEAFGLWGTRAVDGLDYERKLRDEW